MNTNLWLMLKNHIVVKFRTPAPISGPNFPDFFILSLILLLVLFSIYSIIKYVINKNGINFIVSTTASCNISNINLSFFYFIGTLGPVLFVSIGTLGPVLFVSSLSRHFYNNFSTFSYFTFNINTSTILVQNFFSNRKS